MNNLFVKYTPSFLQNLQSNSVEISSAQLDNTKYSLVSYNDKNYIVITENNTERVVLADYVYSVSIRSKEENLQIIDNLNQSGYQAYLPFPDTCHYIIYTLLPQTNNISETLLSITTLNIIANNHNLEFSLDGISEESLIPNDTLYSQQWYLPMVQAPSAWDITTGSNNVTVAVLDTGVSSSNTSLSADIRPKLIPGASFVTTEPDTFDGRGHGTQCSHLIGAVTNNASAMAGIAWSCRIAPVKVLSSAGSGTWSALSAGILWAADNNCDVLSASLGGSVNTVTDSGVITAIDYAIARNCVLVFAAGNSGPSGNNPPANCNPVISAGAVTSANATSSFSSIQSGALGGRCNNKLTVCAPGSSVLSIDQNDTVANVNGTSFACPIVAGCCALLKSINKNFTHAQIKDFLQRSAGNGTNTYENDYRGFGLLNIRRALELAGPLVTPTPTVTPGLTSTPTPTTTSTPTPSPSPPPANGSILLNGDFASPSSLNGRCTNNIGVDLRQEFVAAPPWYIYNNCTVCSCKYCDNSAEHNRYVAMGWTSNLGYISQTINTQPGLQYECKFDMGCEPGYNSFNVPTRNIRAIVYDGPAFTDPNPRLDWTTPSIFNNTFSINNIITGNNYASFGWQSKSFRFTAISNTTTIRFQVPAGSRSVVPDPVAECLVALDNISVITTGVMVTPTPTQTTGQANNTANFNSCASWNGNQGTITTVGSNGRASSYGTYDQTGNVNEWVVSSSNTLVARGGGYFVADPVGSSYRVVQSNTSLSGPGAGFRLCSSSNFLNLPNFRDIADINNSPDQTVMIDNTSGYGSVGYQYKIGAYLVTNCEYVEFLNAIAKTDTYQVYNSNMTSQTRGGINISGSSGNFSYSLKPNMGNKPVNYISWFSMARYCNWLHNGKPTGNQISATTEGGSYTLNGATVGSLIPKNSGASYWIPIENEWYKAAYYKASGANAGYWKYATQSDSTPSCVTSNSVGDGPVPSTYVCGSVGLTPTPTATMTPTPTSSTLPSITPTPTQTPSTGSCNNKIITVCIPGNILRSNPNASNICFRVGGQSCCVSDTQPPTPIYSTQVCLPIPPPPSPTPSNAPQPTLPCVPSVVNAPLTMEIAYESTLQSGSIPCGQGSHSCNRTIFDVMINGTSVGTANLNNANDGGSRSSRVSIPDSLITGDSFTFELRCTTSGCHWGVAIVRILDKDNNRVYQSCLANDQVFVIRRCPGVTPTPTPA